jgi:hypothetical protein
VKIIEPVTIEEYSALLMRKESGVSLDLSSMPQPIEGYAGFRAVLEVDDVDRIFLWFEFHQHTKHGTAKRTDAPPETVDLERVIASKARQRRAEHRLT